MAKMSPPATIFPSQQTYSASKDVITRMTAGTTLEFEKWKRLWVLALALLVTLPLQNTLSAQSDDILDRFTLSERNGIVQLDWTISKGSTCNGIGILRSVDSVNFDGIGKIAGLVRDAGIRDQPGNSE